MNGRLEGEQLLNKKCLDILKNMPNYVSDWYDQMRASKTTASSRKDYLYKIKKFLEYIHNDPKEVKIEELNYHTVVNYMNTIETKSTINGELVSTTGSYQRSIWYALNSFFKYLEEEELIDRNPMNRVGQSKKNDLTRINKNRILLTRKDFNKILKVTKDSFLSNKHSGLLNRDMTILILFMSTGIRVTALTQINISDIDLIKHTLMVTDKEDADRECHLTNLAIEYIEKWLTDRKNYITEKSKDALFITEEGDRMQSITVRQMVKRITKEAMGVELSPHKFRSGFCSILYQDTKDLELVRRTVGHSSSITTQRYIVIGDQDKLKVMSSVERIGAEL